MRENLGKLLVGKKIITEQQLQNALVEQKSSGERLGSTLIKLGFIEEDTLLSFLSNHYGISSINLREFSINPDLTRLIPADLAQKYLVFPLTS